MTKINNLNQLPKIKEYFENPSNKFGIVIGNCSITCENNREYKINHRLKTLYNFNEVYQLTEEVYQNIIHECLMSSQFPF